MEHDLLLSSVVAVSAVKAAWEVNSEPILAFVVDRMLEVEAISTGILATTSEGEATSTVPVTVV